jgi:hypothetical protein
VLLPLVLGVLYIGSYLIVCPLYVRTTPGGIRYPYRFARHQWMLTVVWRPLTRIDSWCRNDRLGFTVDYPGTPAETLRQLGYTREWP